MKLYLWLKARIGYAVGIVLGLLASTFLLVKWIQRRKLDASRQRVQDTRTSVEEETRADTKDATEVRSDAEVTTTLAEQRIEVIADVAKDDELKQAELLTQELIRRRRQ